MSVQTAVQYVFIHKVMVEYMQSKHDSASAAKKADEQEVAAIAAELDNTLAPLSEQPPTTKRRGSVFVVKEEGEGNSEGEGSGSDESSVHHFKTKTFTRTTPCSVCGEILEGVAKQVCV